MKKGFTLLELLAVIVVLAIIALIVTPFVTSAIKSAKKGAFKDSMYGIITSAELYNSKKMFNNDFSETIIHSINGIEINGLDFKYKGKTLENIYLEISNEGKIRLLGWDSGFCARKEFNDSEVEVIETLQENCSLESLSPPVISGGSEEWAVERTISVISNDDAELDHYQYYLTTNDNGILSGGHWVNLPNEIEVTKSITINAAMLKQYENSSDPDFEINLKREYYVYFRAVDRNNLNGLVSNMETVKIDTEEYDITIIPPTNGSLSVIGNINKAQIGTLINAVTVSNTGYELDTLTYNGIDFKTTKKFTMPRQDTTLAANYAKTNYRLTWTSAPNGTISVNVNGALKNSPASVVMGDIITVVTSPNSGYSLNTLIYNETNIKSTKKFTMPAENSQLSVSWIANKYNVTLNNQGATTSGTDNVEATYNGAMPQITAPQKNGYTFGGYYSETNGAGVKYYNANGTSAQKWDYANTATLYAKWTVNNYEIVYDLDGGTFGASHPNSIAYGSALRITNPSKIGYTFAGWTCANCNTTTSKKYSSSWIDWSTPATDMATNTAFASLTPANGGSVTMKANWSVNSYTIAYDLNGGAHGGSHPTRATYGLATGISNPTRIGYTFTGWTCANCNTTTSMRSTPSWGSWVTPATTKAKDVSFASLTPTNGGSVTMKANWVATKVYLYKDGNEFTDITGGWEVKTRRMFDLNLVSSKEETLYLSTTTCVPPCDEYNQESGIAFISKNAVNMRGFNKLYINFTEATTLSKHYTHGGIAYGISTSDSLRGERYYVLTDYVASEMMPRDADTPSFVPVSAGLKAIDISSYKNGNYYITIISQVSGEGLGQKSIARISEIYLAN